MISELKFFGNSLERTMASDYTAYPTKARTYIVKANAAGLKFIFAQPFSPTFATGIIITVVNVSPVNSFEVRDHLGNLLTTLSAGQSCDCILVSDGPIAVPIPKFSSDPLVWIWKWYALKMVRL